MRLKKSFFSHFIVIISALLACGKNTDAPTTPANTGSGTNNNEGVNCVMTSISQVNSGSSSESSLSATYNSNYQVTKLTVYDSTDKAKSFEANFKYVTADSVRISPFQYILLDGNKRVTRFVTKSDISDPEHADDYVFEYTYNADGYLETKNCFINGSAKANFSTTYSYTNQQLTSCLMTIPIAGNLKVLEATLAYGNQSNIKSWIYTFPDAMEGYPFSTMLNFGKHVAHPLNRVVTKIYDPQAQNLIDTWTTNYANYIIDINGYILSGEATGDLQQGIASFYGKTNFYYACH
jgi:hypothetical protein